MPSRPDLGAVLAVAVLLRLAYWAFVTPDWVPAFDAHHYLLLARNLADGEGFALVYPQLELHPTAFRPPLYPLVLAPFVAFTEALWPARLLSVALGSLVAVLAAVVAGGIAGRRAALAAGGIVAAYPPLLANDTITLTEPLALALLLAVVLLLERSSWRWAGAACGALLLTRPNAYLVAALAVIVALRRAGWRAAVATAAVTVLVVTPWVVRNQVQVGTPRLVTSDAFTLAAVFSLRAQAEERFVDPVFDERFDDDEELRLSQFHEAEWSRELLARAWEGIRTNPGYLWDNAWENAGRFFELDPDDNEHPETLDGRDLDFRDATLWTFYVVTAAGIAGWWRHRRHPTMLLVAVLAAQFAVLSIAILSPPRLRAPFDLACCIGAGVLVAPQRAASSPPQKAVTADASA